MEPAAHLIQRINVGDSLTRTAAARPDHPAVVDGDRRWTYGELNAWVNRLAHGLAARGYAPGDGLGLASGTARSSWRCTTPAPSSASSACRSTSGGGPTRSPTSWTTRGPAAW